ncbi:LuxR C-terminal-related transcriptional regulator [Antrihabitans cavernicola]|uniref:LuxR family transcriptional regulator n=1 Tax=Antrihabitans cavernicola TaxID=2495913 RepID=A0A5A7S6B5_9NOCA|nr:LuxR C-terminal-related transcriptional regulator [Spelaeibacter cavernicola]KAA0021436.1 LuxR family transcriptional regulator [Spelaeibacter cavernicola]
MANAVTITAQAGLAEVYREVASATGSTVVLVRGTAQSGKTALLEGVRGRLRADGVALSSDDGQSVTSVADGAAVVVDDAHALTPDRLSALTTLIEHGNAVVVLASEPRPHNRALRALVSTVSARGRIFDLRPLSSAEIITAGRELGIAVSAQLAQTIHDITGGTNNGVLAALDAARADIANADARTVTAAVGRWVASILKSHAPELLSTLALTAVGCGLDPADVAAVAEVDDDRARDLIDRVRACGLVTEPDLLLPIAAEPLRTVSGERKYLAVQQRLFDVQFDAGGLRLHTAMGLAETGLRDARLGAFLRAGAHRSELFSAARMYAAAALAGADRDSMAVRHSVAAVVSGDLTTATSLAEGVLTATDVSTSDLSTAVAVLAGISAYRGVLTRSAELYRWLGPERSGAVSGVAAAVMVAVGDSTAAAAFMAAGAAGPPTDAVAGAAQLGAAMVASISTPGVASAGALGRAATTLTGTDAASFVPGSAASVAVLACLHIGDLTRAQDIVTRAVAADRPGSLTWCHHQLLTAWTAMLAGDDQGAHAIVDTIDADGLGPRNALFANAIRVGLARRAGDHGGLSAAWGSAVRMLHDVSPDLFMLLPLGELWLGGIRLGESGTIAHVIDEAAQVLRNLGEPALWSNTFHWYGVQAAILAAEPTDMLPHAEALKAAAATGDSYAAALAGAGGAWLRVLQDRPDAVEVQQFANTLGRIGLSWDGARLASEAALRVSDTAQATALLQVARGLRQDTRKPVTAGEAAPRAVGAALTDREVEVADLLVLGLTYREMGARLFISAKTVEHHVARIRRRLSAGSRSEMLSLLRAMGYGKTDEVLAR